MILFLKSEQFSLFDAPVIVSGHVRKDGAYVGTHTRIQKVALHTPGVAHVAPAPVKRTRLDAFIDSKGGIGSLGATLARMTDAQRKAVFTQMAGLGDTTAEAVAAMFPKGATGDDRLVTHDGDTWRVLGYGATRDDGQVFAHLASTTRGVHQKNGWNPLQISDYIDAPKPEVDRKQTGSKQEAISAHKIVEHVTKNGAGKTLRGIVRTDLTGPEAKEIDPYTFKKDGGWFIREKHLTATPVAVAETASMAADIDSKKLDDLREMLSGMVDTKRLAGEPVNPAWLNKLAEIDAEIGPKSPVQLGQTKAPVDRSGWSESRALAQDLRDEYERDKVGFLDDPKKLSEFKRKLRRTAKKIPESDSTAVMQIDLLATKVFGENYDPKRAEIIFASTSHSPDLASSDETEPLAVAPDPLAPFGVPAGVSKVKRREINNAVIAALDTDSPDPVLLRQYSGNGGCGDSLNEFYTDPDVARGMWTALASMGAKSGDALEPSCATGVFIHTAPAGFKVTGVELDPVSAQVAQRLHGDRHEIVNASFERFATTDNRKFDVVIGNPPYGPRGRLAKDDKKQIATCEQYFTDTALDKCEDGGIVALVVPTGIMDSSAARSFRTNMLCKAEFLGAQRMPNTAFEHSHTEVTTDIIYLRKRPQAVAGALGALTDGEREAFGVKDDEFVNGGYFTGRGAGNVLGSMEAGWRAKAGMGNDITVEGSMVGVADAVAAFVPEPQSDAPPIRVSDIVKSALGEAQKARIVARATFKPYDNTAKVGDTKVIDGVSYVLQGDPPRWNRVDEFLAGDAITDARAVAERIESAMETGDSTGLKDAVDEYVKKHGIPADNPELLIAASLDKVLYRMVGAVNRKGELSDVVTGASRKVEGSFDATAQILTLDRVNGQFTPEELATRLGKKVDDVTEQLVADARYAYAGNGEWASMDAYLTGELWPKLDAVNATLTEGKQPELSGKLREQATKLEALIDPKSLDDVDVEMNSAFVPTHVLGAFLTWRHHEGPNSNEWSRKHEPTTVTFNKEGSIYSVSDKMGDGALVEKYLNRKGIRKETEKPTIDAMNEEFRAWLCGSTYREPVEAIYNRSFRGFVAPHYSDEPIDVPGLAPDKNVRSWRWSSLRRSLAQGKGIIADDVGLGKTLGGLLLARMAKLQGAAKKPIIVAPKSVLANWFVEAETWFPGARVLTIGQTYMRGADGSLIGRDDGPDERARKWHDLTQNDYDFVIVSEPSFQDVDLNPILKEEYYSTDFWNQRGDALGNAGDKKRNKIRENHDQAVARRELGGQTDAIYFDDLGVDMLIADEMHHQKNLYSANARWGKQPKFLGGSNTSGRSLDFNLKTRYVREHNNGKNVHGLTATPTSNSPLEIYSMLAHIAPEAFENIGIRNAEEFIDRFCKFEDDKILSTKGGIEEALVVSGFKNMDELREIMSKYIDRRIASEVGLELPKRDDRLHFIDMNPAQLAVYAELRERGEKAAKSDDVANAHVFSIMSDMTKAATDLELYNPKLYVGAPSPKLDAVARECAAGAKDGGQIVFCEHVDSHKKLVAAMMAVGFKRSEIGVINADVATGSSKRLSIADGLNEGRLKVVIGNCTMAEGLNMQKRTTDIHHVDVPWTPAAIQQRNGRGLRQGNTRESVRIHTYLSKGSFDGYRYQSVSAKKDWQDTLWNGGNELDNLAREGNLSRDEMRIAMAANPDEARAVYDADKTAATIRFESGKRVDAQKQFIKLADMKASYAALKNKKTDSAIRLRNKLESSKTALANNKFFTAKSALDKDGDVLIHPKTGVVLEKDVGLDLGEKDGGKAVVEGVDMRAGTVKLRRHADTSGGRSIWTPLDRIADAKPFKFDAAAEAAEMQAHFEKVAAESLNTLKDYDSVKRLPSAVLEANHDLIQRQMKDGAKSYKFSFPYGDVPMVNRDTGAIEMASSYGHTDKHATHDYMLPTEANKEKLAQAWMAAERGKKFGTEFLAGKKRSPGKSVPRVVYADAKYDSKSHNPWLRSYLDAHGETKSYSGGNTPAHKALIDRFATEQLARVRRAKTFKEALVEAIPLTEMSEYNHDTGLKPKWSAKALTMLWARARRDGVLDKDIVSHLPMAEVNGRSYKKHDSYLMHDQYHGNDQTIHGTLLRLAQGSGHRDLADAMIQAQAKRKAV